MRSELSNAIKTRNQQINALNDLTKELTSTVMYLLQYGLSRITLHPDHFEWLHGEDGENIHMEIYQKGLLRFTRENSPTEEIVLPGSIGQNLFNIVKAYLDLPLRRKK